MGPQMDTAAHQAYARQRTFNRSSVAHLPSLLLSPASIPSTHHVIEKKTDTPCQHTPKNVTQQISALETHLLEAGKIVASNPPTPNPHLTAPTQPGSA